MEKNKKILITGCPRSGTTYTSKLLQRCGKDVTHEHRIGEDGIVSWLLTPTIEDVTFIRQRRNFKSIHTNSKTHYMWRPFHWDHPIPTAEFKSEFGVFLHQVRDPIRCISSMTSLRERSMRCTNSYVKYPIPPVPFEDMTFGERRDYRFRRQMYFWYYWNKIGIKNSQWHYCVENLGTSAKKGFCDRLQITEADFDKAYRFVSKSTNRRRKHLISWSKMRRVDEEMYGKISRLGESLGYDCG
jgi:hypothetical protein